MKYREKKFYKYVVEELYMKDLDLDEYPELARECNDGTSIVLETFKGGILGWIEFPYSGNIVIKINSGYTFDGPSGATLDTPNSMEAALVHDFLYQMVRENLISVDCKGDIDNIFYNMLRENGMGKIRAWIWYQGVKKFGHKALKSKVITV